MPRFPTRTLILMSLALLSFVWMYFQTHRQKAQAQEKPISPVQMIVLIDAGVSP